MLVFENSMKSALSRDSHWHSWPPWTPALAPGSRTTVSAHSVMTSMTHSHPGAGAAVTRGNLDSFRAENKVNG